MIWRVSASGRTCGRPRQRRSWVVSISAMPLHDACHSIDSSNVGSILENIKFPKWADAQRRPSGVTFMTRHSTAFEAERPVPADDTVKDLAPDTYNDAGNDAGTGAPVHTPSPVRKLNFRKVLMA